VEVNVAGVGVMNELGAASAERVVDTTAAGGCVCVAVFWADFSACACSLASLAAVTAVTAALTFSCRLAAFFRGCFAAASKLSESVLSLSSLASSSTC